MLGLKVLYNDELSTYGRSSNDELLVFGLNTSDHYTYTSIMEVKAPKVFRYNFFNENDVILIEVDPDLNNHNSFLDYEDYVTFLQKIQYEYYHKKINDTTEREIFSSRNSRLGISICLNGRCTDISLVNNENINLSVVIQKDKAIIGLGALAKSGDSFRRRIWLDREPLNIGTKLTIEYKEISKETPFLSEAIDSECLDINSTIETYQSIRDSLIKKGIISAS